MRTLLIAFASRRLTMVCMAMAIVLLLVGVFTQFSIGLSDSIQSYFFRFVVTWIVPKTELAIPVFPGGYSIGLVLCVNLIVSLISRFRLDSRRLSLSTVYIGVILLIIAEFISSSQSVSSEMVLNIGDTVRYSEDVERIEIALIDTTSDPNQERVIAIPQEMLEREREVRIGELPFTISVDRFLRNSTIVERTSETALTGPIASFGAGKNKTAIDDGNENGNSSVYLTLYSDHEIIGTWLLSESLEDQDFEYGGVQYTLSLRSERYYYPYSLSLKDVEAEYHDGTDILKKLAATLEMRTDQAAEKNIVSISPGNALKIGDNTFFLTGEGMRDSSLRLNISYQPVKPLFVLASIAILLGLGTRLIAFLLIWLQENAREAP